MCLLDTYNAQAMDGGKISTVQNSGNNPRFWLWRVHWKFFLRILISVIKLENSHLPSTGCSTAVYAHKYIYFGKSPDYQASGPRNKQKQQQKCFQTKMDSSLEDSRLPWQNQASSSHDVFQEHQTCQSKHKSLIHLFLIRVILMLSLSVPE